MHNLSCENEFYLHENEKWFHIKGWAYPRFETEARGNSETAYCRAHFGSSSFLAWRKGHFHDEDIWPQLPGSISLLLSYSNLSIPLRFKKNNSTNLHKKTTNWRILVVVVKVRHCAIVLLVCKTVKRRRTWWTRNSIRNWTLFWCRNVLLFREICMSTDHESENDL